MAAAGPPRRAAPAAGPNIFDAGPRPWVRPAFAGSINFVFPVISPPNLKNVPSPAKVNVNEQSFGRIASLASQFVDLLRPKQ